MLLKLTSKIMHLVLSLILVLCLTQPAFAFGSGAHYVVMERVTQGLSYGNQIRTAMQNYPEVSAWGALGPDLGYAAVRFALGGYAPWGDRFHYDRVGSFAARMLQDALLSGDQKQIAFASGWITHITGDLACHGLFVNPEAGVYLDNPDGRELHTVLEKSADSYIWTVTGGRTYSNLGNFFVANSAVPSAFLSQTAASFYGVGLSESDITGSLGWLNLMSLVGIGNGYNYNTALANLNEGSRLTRLNQAYSTAVSRGITLLNAAANGDYSGFTDNWNLDAAEDGRPIGELTVSISTATNLFSGTDGDVYFGMRFADGTVYQRLLDKSGYNDFENGDHDDYYLYLGSSTHFPQAIRQIWVSKPSGSDDWKMKDIQLYLNGRLVYSATPNIWLTSSTTYWRVGVNGF